MPTALEMGERNPPEKKKKSGTALIFHVQTRWEKKHQFVSLAPFRSYGFEMRCCCLRASCLLIPRHCVPYLAVHAPPCHGHVPKITGLLPHGDILPGGGDAQPRGRDSRRGEWKLAHEVPAASAPI